MTKPELNFTPEENGARLERNELGQILAAIGIGSKMPQAIREGLALRIPVIDVEGEDK